MSTAFDELAPQPDTRELVPQPEDRSTTRRVALWFGVVGGLVSWAAHLGISWPLVPYSCDRDNVTWLHVNTVVFAAITIVAFITALVVFRKLRDEAGPDASRSAKAIQTDRFLSILGMLANAYFLLLILAEGASVFVLSPCGIAS